MSRASRAWLTDSRPDPELAWMVGLSVAVHVVAVLAVFLVPRSMLASTPPPIVAYTVKIVDPSALGGRLPRGPIRPDEEPEGAAATVQRDEPKPETKPDPKPPAEEPAEPPKPPEPKAEPNKPDPKPEPQTEEAKTVTLPDKKPEKKAEPEKKPEPKKPATSTAKAPEKKPAAKKPTAEELARAERDRKIQEAISRVGERGTGKTPSGLEGREEGKGAALGTGGDGGGGGTLMGLDFIVYKNRVEGIFKRNWTWVGANPNLTVRIGFRIEEDGEIRNLRILERSGDGSYDESVIRAIRAASPLPPPPDAYREIFADYILDFVSGDMRAG